MDLKTTLTKLHNIMSDKKIGLAVNAPASSIQRLRTGKHKTTFFERGERIKRLAVEKGIKPCQ